MTRTFTLGRYTCVERLGTGPVGELWRAKRFGLVGVEKQFLLTRVHPALAKDTAAVGRLQAALKTYGELELVESPGRPLGGLLRFQELVTAGAGGADTFVVFEFAGFADLRKLRPGFDSTTTPERAAPLWPAVVALLGRALAQSLAQAHERGLWHGLLSPASVWIRLDGRVLLSDLGLAQLLPQSAADWAADANLKPLQAYLPKESQAKAPPGPNYDVFALGVLLGELLGGSDGGGVAESKALLQGLRPLIGRASAGRGERPIAMRELAAALDALPISAVQAEAGRQALARVAQQFQFSGDTVPQAVTISERSSAEPLPPPPAAKTADSKVSIAGASARGRVSQPGSAPGRATARPTPEAGSPARVEIDDTPLPASRPLLVTNPKIVAAGEDPGRKQAPVASRPAEDSPKVEQSSISDGRRSRQSAKERSRSGLDWLKSNSDSLAVEGSETKQEPAKPAAKKVTGSHQASGRPATPHGEPDSQRSQPSGGTAGSGSPASAGAPARARSNPVSVNPGASTANLRPSSPSISTATPTSEIDASAAASELAKLGITPSSGEPPRSAAAPPGQAGQLQSSADSLSIGETSPQLAPIKPAKPRAALGEEPTNPVPLDLVAAAAAAEGTPPPAGSSAAKRRSGPISEPNPRVLSTTAPAAIIPLPPEGAEGQSAEPMSSGVGQAPVVPDVQVQDVQLDAAEKLQPRRRRALLLAGGGVAALLGIGLIYLLVASPASTNHTDKVDASTLAKLDGGDSDVKERPPADTLAVSSTPAAAVIIDGSEKGRTPLTVKLDAGTHKLVLIAEEYALLRREVKGGEKLDLKLKRAELPEDVAGEAVLKIKCKSEGKLRILVDGNDSGRSCPCEELQVSPGKHVLSFVDPSTDESKDKKIKAKKGKKPTKLKVKF